ncbi:unnamed protein product [Notodromas monacha]|uniref:Protein kinase domain-containing protein n=1 Tax=Notodromas monacha TaxID=399045 RepID=A0A7R9BJ47_9CRUS|nr:unnamed protein product [Notodromas monacha]CAG0916447.1 unnamed protein product [Notodromas monacha]
MKCETEGVPSPREADAGAGLLWDAKRLFRSECAQPAVVFSGTYRSDPSIVWTGTVEDIRDRRSSRISDSLLCSSAPCVLEASSMRFMIFSEEDWNSQESAPCLGFRAAGSLQSFKVRKVLKVNPPLTITKNAQDKIKPKIGLSQKTGISSVDEVSVSTLSSVSNVSSGIGSLLRLQRFNPSTTRASFNVSRRPLERVQVTETGSLRIRGDYWPVTLQEAMFLPQFPVRSPVNKESFDVIRPLGEGSFGKVFLVKRKEDGHEFAMKVMSKNQVIQRGILKQCKEEMTIQTMCGHHPFLVGCKFHWQSQKRLYLVTEYVSQGDMMALWKSIAPFSEDLVKIYAAQIIMALDFLHCAGIIYRDLKLENVMLDQEMCIKITDFGLAKWLPHGKRTATICGTMQYMAPEILQMRSYNHCADWWSLGILLFALFAGEFPLGAPDTHEEMLLAVISFDFSLPKDVIASPAARAFLRSLLCIDPQKRPKSRYFIQRDAFFHGTNFDAIFNRKLKPDDLVKKLKMVVKD